MKNNDPSLEQLSKFLLSSSEYSVITSTNGKITSVNDKLLHKLGFAKNDIVGKSVNLIFPENKNIINNILENRFSGNFISGLNRSNNITYIKWFSCGLDLDSNFVLFSGTDVTDILSQSHFFENVVRQSAEVIIVISLSGNIIDWNIGAENLLGYTKKEMVGQSFFKITPDDHIEEAKKCLKLFRDEKCKDCQSKKLTKDGKIIDVSVSGNLVTDSLGSPVSLALFIRDITEIKKQEGELKYHVAVLEDKNKALGILERFIVSRELKLIELKKQISDLSKQATKNGDVLVSPNYDSNFSNTTEGAKN
ncbi:hypothetical protein AUK11_02450 [bacterium CG2_30_37_16]|nr:MAG: hypothetical protein AUK11_02450 [bacterium CG2_30_37_16]PIP30270.1 MAG: hypothetical protein COX25_05600 [bacterium (Candidatus Howlettbacteria) CG23_combo_of_CG06-09_8_20_14_all_37_9]PIY00102.1 MAG: hypothetical protein COZ22_01150 [bacterium (Candidatus Howlettbacteria) CG_4_10_14_3_um_filter_37_10]